jgi:amino acid transporter
LSFNSAVQQLAAGFASLVAGFMIGENELGQLTNFNYVGYLAIIFSLICIPLAWRIKVVS